MILKNFAFGWLRLSGYLLQFSYKGSDDFRFKRNTHQQIVLADNELPHAYRTCSNLTRLLINAD